MVSVVIATLNRPALLDQCLAALICQTLALEAYEVIVVDDGPHEGTAAVVRSWIRRCAGFGLVYRRSAAVHGPAAARNVGWRAARGAVIAFTDDDCIPDPDWLATGWAALSDAGASAIWGRVIVPLSSEPTDWERNVAGLERAPCATANCFYRRAELEAVGGFDEQFTEAWREDSDLQFRVLAQGGRILHEPAAIVEHPVRPAPWGISIRLQKQNRFNALLYKKHPSLYCLSNPHEPPWAYYVTLGLLLAGLLAAVAGAHTTAVVLLAAWVVQVSRFCARRLSGTTHRPSHVVEMIVTSMVIPPYAVFWRLYGAAKYRVAFF